MTEGATVAVKKAVAPAMETIPIEENAPPRSKRNSADVVPAVPGIRCVMRSPETVVF